ncbi:N-6 DNA methylase [Brooklawnia propionicigenes]|uniref:site-specific DNA-methyltransferase (adenine-specific) n=1 Tax=Brooklawnia propionicigenes TaxID=3041175 RepID=A0AAN0KBU7_9ACTN|nr:N-6 DNA methylase [Brooklawnia sp. SH051]BEH02255.1 N-6 DNA methylase [Brooklawnia sp. SH051]
MAAESFVGVRVAGGLLPAELLSRIAAGELAGQTSGDYHLAPGETVREAANRAWAYLTGVWATYRQAAEKLPESDRGTTLTRERWLLILLRELGYGRVPTTPAGGLAAGDKRLPISHVWEYVPVHLLGHRIDLDRRTVGVAGAATSSPQSMVQELLNRSDANQWAILSNGLTLRLLRDSTSLVGSAYIEFDLEAIFDGDLFADFLLLFSVCHQSRLEVRDPEKGPASCWLEAWRTESLESGSRALNQLRDGVIQAITTLGTGLLGHPANSQLRDGLADGSLRIEDINHGLLRVVYRLLFTFVAEDRGLLLAPDADPAIRQRYRDYFSTERLRRTARRRRGTRHTDQWRALNLVWDGLGSVDGRPELGLVGIGGLFEPGALDLFRGCDLSNDALLRAVRYLSLVEEPGSKMKRVVDYRHLGAEELGSIYEALLEFVPSWDAGRRVFELLSAAGNDRKSTGSYYTPTSLIDCLLDSALDPVLDRAERKPDPEAALLALTVCDPACGSGHFLVAAARRIAKRVAAIRTGDPEPPPERVREALGDVVGRCIYGVDLNPLAAELAKVSLWLETLDPGRPLAFLDAQIKVGNSLIGATPALMAQGVPDAAFVALEGDDKKTTTALKKQNKAERSGQDLLFGDDDVALTLDAAVAGDLSALIGGGRPASLADIHARQQRLKAVEANPGLQQQRLLADAWCAAFVWPKQPGGPKAITDRSLHALARGEALPPATLATVHELAAEYRFFHWHLEFPHLFRPGGPTDGPGWRGGFDVVLGNPPWEHIELKEQEFFAVRSPEIGAASGARRKRLIDGLPETNPALAAEYASAKRHIDGTRHFLANSGRYPLCGRGRIKTDTVFAELGRHLMASHGRFGLVLPTGIATDATTQYFFKDLVERANLVSLYDFENRRPLFEGVDSRFKFCLLTLTGRDERVAQAEFAFFAHDSSDLLKDDARFELTPEEIQLLNPNTGTCPIFRTRRDAEITLGIYRRVPVLINENDPVNGNPWGISFMQGLFNMTSDSHLFHTRHELEADGWTLNGNVFERSLDGGGVARMLPLYEAKMIHLYDTRWATYEPDGSIRPMTEEEKATRPSPMPRYWVPESDVDRKLAGRWDKNWFLGWRDICRATDERTSISTVLPRVALGNKIPVAMPDCSLAQATMLQAALASFALDFAARQKLGSITMNYFVFMQLPVLRPDAFSRSDLPVRGGLSAWLSRRVDRLNGWIADEQERGWVRAEIDAAVFHLFGLSRDEVSYVMDTFPIVKRKDEAAFGAYRTKDLILSAYDAMAEAKSSGRTYQPPWPQEVHA